MAIWSDIRLWLTTYALPLWANTGFDETTNTFVERLTLEGAPILDAPRRLMVQARQIYCYSSAEEYGWMAGAGELAARAARAMVDAYHEADGKPGWVMSVASSGEVVDATRDLYAHSFVLLGLAAAFKCTKDEFYLKLADKTLLFLDSAMAYEKGGYFAEAPLKEKLLLTQNPHMHLLEGLLALYEVAPREDYKKRAKAMVSLFDLRLFSSATGMLSEYFDDGWIAADIGRGQTFEPGHHYEWVWLLKKYSDLFNEPLSPHVALLDRMATLHGRSEKGLLWSEVGGDERVTDASFRLWPHTEAAKASISRGDIDSANGWLDVLYREFLKAAHPGGWNDRIGAGGEVLTGYMPASSFYHLVCAFGECERTYALDAKPSAGRI